MWASSWPQRDIEIHKTATTNNNTPHVPPAGTTTPRPTCRHHLRASHLPAPPPRVPPTGTTTPRPTCRHHHPASHLPAPPPRVPPAGTWLIAECQGGEGHAIGEPRVVQREAQEGKDEYLGASGLADGTKVPSEQVRVEGVGEGKGSGVRGATA